MRVVGGCALAGSLRKHRNTGEAQEGCCIVILCLDSGRHGEAPKDGLDLALYFGGEATI